MSDVARALTGGTGKDLSVQVPAPHRWLSLRRANPPPAVAWRSFPSFLPGAGPFARRLPSAGAVDPLSWRRVFDSWGEALGPSPRKICLPSPLSSDVS
jgi:hypothetical protein